MCIQASVTCRSAGAHLRVRLIVLIQNPVALQHTLPLEGIWWYDLVCDQSFLRSQRTEFDEQSANWVGSCQSCPTASITLGFRGPVIIRSLARLMVHPCPSYHAGLLLLQNLRPENPNQHLADLAPFVAIYIYIYVVTCPDSRPFNSVFSRPIIPLKATHFVGISGFEPHLLHITVVRIQCDGAHHLQSWGPQPLTNIQHLAPSSLSTPIELIWLFIFPPFWSTYIYHWFQSCLGEGHKCTVCKENWNIHYIYMYYR